MYLGRIVAIGNTLSNKLSALYRISSKSFPNRELKINNQSVTVIPKKGYEDSVKNNPFVVYNCLCVSNQYAIVGNGTHTDIILEKLKDGLSMRNCLTNVLLGFDFEHDEYSTPRIAGIINKTDRIGALEIIRKNAIFIEEFELPRGLIYYISTYNHNYINKDFSTNDFNINTASEGCNFIYNQSIFNDFDFPVSSACALEAKDGFQLGNYQL